jgi:AcrR family transcriptional regulator
VSQRKSASPKPRASYHHGDLRRALLDAAVGLIDERGPDAFTLRETARKVGVNHAAVYRHFEDKSALLAAVAEQGFVALSSRMREAVVGIPSRHTLERLREMGLAYLAFGVESPSHYRVMFGERIDDGGRFPALSQAVREASGILHEEMKEGARQGLFIAMSPRDLGVAFWTMAHGYTSLVLGRKIRAKSPKHAEEYWSVLLAPLLRGLAR